MKKIIKIQVYLIFILYIIFNGILIKNFYEKTISYQKSELKSYDKFFLKSDILDFQKKILIELFLYNCDFSKHYIEHVQVISYLRIENVIEQYKKNLKKAFHTCDMKQQEIFFHQIGENNLINLNDDLSEKEQIENIINYYYLIDSQSLLHEMQKKNYQSQDALLIMEKLKIDIQWKYYEKINKRG